MALQDSPRSLTGSDPVSCSTWAQMLSDASQEEPTARRWAGQRRPRTASELLLACCQLILRDPERLVFSVALPCQNA